MLGIYLLVRYVEYQGGTRVHEDGLEGGEVSGCFTRGLRRLPSSEQSSEEVASGYMYVPHCTCILFRIVS